MVFALTSLTIIGIAYCCDIYILSLGIDNIFTIHLPYLKEMKRK